MLRGLLLNFSLKAAAAYVVPELPLSLNYKFLLKNKRAYLELAIKGCFAAISFHGRYSP